MLIQQVAEVPNYFDIRNELYAVHCCSLHLTVFEEHINSYSLISVVQAVWPVVARPWDVGGGSNSCKGHLRIGDRDHSRRLGSANNLQQCN
jgi:hypothetical protein